MMRKNIEMAKYYKFFLYLIIVILANLISLNLFFRGDLTASGLYSLSKASKNAVSTLKEPLTVNVFFTKNLPPPYNNVERYLHDLLEEYAIHGKRHFNYRFFDVSAKEGDLSERAEENRKMAQDYGVYPINVRKIEQDEAKVQRAYMGMVLLHGDIIERIAAVTTTEGLEYKITTTIQKMNNKISALLNLPEKIKVKLIQSSSLNQIAPLVNLQGLKEFKSRVEKSVQELNNKVYGQLEFVFIDPSAEGFSGDIARYERFGLQWPELFNPDGSVIPAGKGILGLGMDFGGRSFERSLLNKSLNLTSRGFREQFSLVEIDQISSFIEENVDNLIEINDEIGYVSSNGTLELSVSLPPQLQMMQPQQGSLTKFNSLLSGSYSIERIDLGKDDIPESIHTLIIAGPKEPFSDWALFQIDQFLMKGKSLAIFLESFNEVQPQSQQQMYGMNQTVYLPINSGLEKLLSHYGVEVKKSYVMDESCYVNRDRNAGEMPIYFAPIIKNENINHKLDFMKSIKELILLKTSPITTDEEKLKENDLKSHVVFSSSQNSWEMSGRINLTPFMIRPPVNEEEKKSSALAYVLEGEFPSYFADKPVPEKPEPEQDGGEEKEEKKETEQSPGESRIKTEKSVISKGQQGRVFVIGTAEILKDNILDERLGEISPSMFLINSIDFLNKKTDIALMRSKRQRFNPLKDTRALTRTFIKILNVAGLPILFILSGFFVWVRRKKKRRMIQSIFLQKT